MRCLSGLLHYPFCLKAVCCCDLLKNLMKFPLSVLRLFETLQSLFWSIFGLLNLYVTNVKARHEFTEFVGATMFGTYNVISLVVLLNMLIAMMNNSYQLIAVSESTSVLKGLMSEGKPVWCHLSSEHSWSQFLYREKFVCLGLVCFLF